MAVLLVEVLVIVEFLGEPQEEIIAGQPPEIAAEPLDNTYLFLIPLGGELTPLTLQVDLVIMEVGEEVLILHQMEEVTPLKRKEKVPKTPKKVFEQPFSLLSRQ